MNDFPCGTPAHAGPSYAELERLLREAFNAMDEVRCALIGRADATNLHSVWAMTLADSQRDIKAAGIIPACDS